MKEKDTSLQNLVWENAHDKAQRSSNAESRQGQVGGERAEAEPHSKIVRRGSNGDPDKLWGTRAKSQVGGRRWIGSLNRETTKDSKILGMRQDPRTSEPDQSEVHNCRN